VPHPLHAPPLTLGILGCAEIARGFVPGVAPSPHLRVTHVASRDTHRAAAFAAEFGVPHWNASYEALIAEPTVQALYVPLPNHLHAPWVLRALEAGKHVLCEKPLALDAAQAQAMFDAAARHGRVLLEAFPYLFQPQTERLHAMLREGRLGTLRLMQASFGFPLERAGNYRHDPAQGGGALLDVGCYPVSLARLLFGARPQWVTAQAEWGSSGEDRRLTATLRFEGGAQAQIACAFDTAVHRHAMVVGDAGVAFTDFQNHTAADRPGHLRVRSAPGWDVPLLDEPYRQANGFRAEAEAFAAMVRGEAEGRRLAMQALSLDVAATLDAVRAAAASGRPVVLAQGAA
jgi:predicted dehydrogenase